MTSHPCDRGLQRLIDRLQIHLVHLRTADAVSEWREETHLLPQRVRGPSLVLLGTFSGALEVLEWWQALRHDVEGSLSR